MMAFETASPGPRHNGSAGGVASTLVDGHAHFHGCFHRDSFLESALGHFRRGAEELGLGPKLDRCLLLVDGEGQDSLRDIRAGAGAQWTCERTTEEGSLAARHREDRDGGATMVLIGGQQIRTSEGLEVLAFCCRRRLAGGRSFLETMAEVKDSGTIPIVPWGFGKWTFGRRAIVEQAIAAASPGDLFLGDNKGRLRWGPRPRLFALAEERGILLLPGSDPLPFARHGNRAGSYGFALAGEIGVEEPGRRLKELLETLAAQPKCYGRPEDLVGFLRQQVEAQLKKQLRRFQR